MEKRMLSAVPQQKRLPVMQAVHSILKTLPTTTPSQVPFNFTSFLCGEEKERSKICVCQEPHEMVIG